MFVRRQLSLCVLMALAACGQQAEKAESADEFAARINGQEQADAMGNQQAGQSVPTAPQTATPLPGAAAGPMEPRTQTDPASADCGATQVASYLGREATPDVRAELVKAASAADVVRFRSPGPFVTPDTRSDRLNVMLDNRNIIRDLRCQ